MKKSEIYKMAMAAVIDCGFISINDKVEIVALLADRASTETLFEERDGVENELA